MQKEFNEFHEDLVRLLLATEVETLANVTDVLAALPEEIRIALPVNMADDLTAGFIRGQAEVYRMCNRLILAMARMRKLVAAAEAENFGSIN